MDEIRAREKFAGAIMGDNLLSLPTRSAGREASA